MQGGWRPRNLNFHTTAEIHIIYGQNILTKVEHNKPISTNQNV